MAVTSATRSVQWCFIAPSSNVRRTVEHFSEESDKLKVSIPGSIMKRSVVFLVSTQWVTVLLQGEVLHLVCVLWCGVR